MDQYTLERHESAKKNADDTPESMPLLKRHLLIRASTLSMSHKHYLMELNVYLGPNADAWPAQTTLARAMSAGLSSVKKWQAELTRMGILLVDSGKGCNASNRYRMDLSRLPMPLDHDSEWSTTETSNGLPQRPLQSNSLPDRPEWSTTETINSLPDRPLMVYDVATKEHVKEHVKDQIKKHSPGSVSLFDELDSQTTGDPSQPQSTDQGFPEWYATYPRRVGKGAAAKAYRTTIKKLSKRYQGSEQEAAEFLMDRATKFAASPAGQNGQFTAYPATWLNQARYDDDATEWCKGKAETGKSHSDFGAFNSETADLPW